RNYHSPLTYANVAPGIMCSLFFLYRPPRRKRIVFLAARLFAATLALLQISFFSISSAAMTASFNSAPSGSSTNSSTLPQEPDQPTPTVQFLGGGSSAMFLELGQAAQSSAITGTPCVWTHGSDLNVVARDNRPAAFPPNLPIDETGDIWI